MFYPKKLIVPVFVCAVLAGVGLHFLYARFPCTLSALLSPVRESLWEHIKILYWPYLAASAFLAWGRPTGMRPWLLSLVILCPLMLVLGLLPLGAFAEEEAPTTEPTAAQTVATEPETEPTQTESAEQGETTSPTLVGSAMQQEQTAELTEAAPAEDADAAASPEPVIVTDLPAFVPVKTGDPCTLTVTAEGTGTLTYQWYACSDNVYKGNKIKNATGASYSPATLKEEIAYYYVEITNTEEGKTPTVVRSAIVKVGVSDDGTGTFKRYRKDSFWWYKKVIESNGGDLG